MRDRGPEVRYGLALATGAVVGAGLTTAGFIGLLTASSLRSGGFGLDLSAVGSFIVLAAITFFIAMIFWGVGVAVAGSICLALLRGQVRFRRVTAAVLGFTLTAAGVALLRLQELEGVVALGVIGAVVGLVVQHVAKPPAMPA